MKLQKQEKFQAAKKVTEEQAEPEHYVLPIIQSTANINKFANFNTKARGWGGSEG